MLDTHENLRFVSVPFTVFIKVSVGKAFRNIGEDVVTPYSSIIVGTCVSFGEECILAMNHHNITMPPANVSEV